MQVFDQNLIFVPKPRNFTSKNATATGTVGA